MSSSAGVILNGVQLTAGESRIAAAILETHAGKIELDWPMIAEKAGHKTPKTARDGWRLVRIKANLNTDAAPGTAPASAKKADGSEPGATPKRGRGRPPKKTMMLTPGAGGDEGDAVATPGSAMANLSFGDMTPETPSKTGSGVKRSAEEADPDAILFEETPAKKKATPRKRLTAKQKAEMVAQKAEVAAAATALAASIDEPADATTTADFQPVSSHDVPAGGANGNGDNIDLAMESISQAEEAIGDILAADAADAADLVGGIDPGEI